MEKKNKCNDDVSVKPNDNPNADLGMEIAGDINNTNVKANTGISKKKIDCLVSKKNKLNCQNQNGRIRKRSNSIYKKLEQCFAVNLCLCGAQDNPGVPIITSNNSNESKNVFNKKMPFFRRSKSMNLPSKEIRLSNMSNKSTRLPCPSKCICFHKVPSNTSINKLLETLTNWNGELNENIEDYTERDKINTLDVIKSLNKSFDKHKNTNQPAQSPTIKVIESLNQLLQKNKSMRKPFQSNETSKHINSNREMSYSCYMTDSSNCKQKCNVDNEHNLTFATTTPSEYMGAINLDKSNDDFCKCVISDKTDNKLNIKCQLEKPLKYINPDPCCKKSQLSKDQGKSNFGKDIPEFQKEFQVQSFISQDQKITETDTNSSPTVKDVTEGEIKGDSFICDIVNKSELFPNNRDYFVKFLGVTLFNNDKKENKSNTPTSSRNNNHNTNSAEDEKNQTSSHRLSKTSKCNLSNCNYAKLLEESRHNFSPKNNNKEEKITIADENDEEKEDDKCVCCDNAENTKDLEVNAFNLLKEHLKEKFAEFKQTSKFTGIPTDEENKLFNSVLENIKQIISENTPKQTPCSCLLEKQDKGTWSRAYGLLLEYLKIKIKKVECSCIKMNNNNTSETILPASILDKITDLIEKDFDRLKDKYKTVTINSNYKSSDIQTTDSLFDKSGIKYYLNKIGIMRDTGTNKSTEDISAQVPYHFSLENKSCDAIHCGSYYGKALEKVVSCQTKSNQMYVTDCNCLQTDNEKYYSHKNVIINQCNEIVANSKNSNKKSLNNLDKTLDLKLNLCEKVSKQKANTPNINKELEPQSSLPYIGYTLSCSCDGSLGSCICSKSAVQTNKDKIKGIWKSLINHNIPKKISYIMHEMPTRVKSEIINLVDPKNNLCLNSMPKSGYSQQVKYVSNTYTNTLNIEQGLVLKDSNKRLNNSCHDSYTFDETSLDINGNNIHQPYWYDCGSFPHSNRGHDVDRTTMDRNMLYDSIYLPAQELETNDNKCDLVVCKEKTSSPLLLNKCDCRTVPICHVKLLVEDIEKKMIYSKCTCDSLSSEVCPIHSNKFCFR